MRPMAHTRRTMTRPAAALPRQWMRSLSSTPLASASRAALLRSQGSPLTATRLAAGARPFRLIEGSFLFVSDGRALLFVVIFWVLDAAST